MQKPNFGEPFCYYSVIIIYSFKEDHSTCDTMITQDHEIAQGWPLGLENMSIRLRVAAGSQVAVAEPLSLDVPSASFSSFSSSNLDTESTASFFQDHSVSLGRLIGIRPGDRGSLYFPNRIHSEEHENISSVSISRGREAEFAQGLCVPLLGIIEKMSRSKSNSRRLN